MAASKINRREVVKNLSLGIGALAIGTTSRGNNNGYIDTGSFSSDSLKGLINHSVCKWCYSKIPLEKFSDDIKNIGIKAIDLLKPDEWGVVQKKGIQCSLGTDTFANIQEGFNDFKNHESLQKQYIELITKASHAGVKQVIVFSGNRNGISDTVGLENCAKGLDVLVKHAEKNNVTLIMELLNSKVDHVDYQCDHTDWGVALVDKIGSTNFKLLYDIYHMQIMEGNIIATINKYKEYINHYHTAGVPGRHEINDAQELNYAAIMKTIAGTGFKGYVAQEFIPTSTNVLDSLQEGITICDI